MKNFNLFLVTKIILILLIGCSTDVLSAQVSIGLKAGLAKSWRANIPHQDDEYIRKTGIQFSILSYTRISKILNSGIEPGYVPRMTSSIFFEFEGPGTESKVYVNYITLPFYISGRYPLWNERLKLNVKAGYGISWLVGATREFPLGQFMTEHVIIKQTRWLNKMDNGFYTGIGIDYAVGKNSIRLESDLYVGLRDALSFALSKNRNVNTSIGYSLGF